MIKEIFNLIKYQRRYKKYLINVSEVFYQHHQNLNSHTVIRENFLVDICRNKRVLHFGFLDSPFTAKKIDSGQLLHLKLKEVTKYIFGVDIDNSDLRTYVRKTNDQDNILLDIQQYINKKDLRRLTKDFNLIIFPEILEHLQNPGIALKNLYKLGVANNYCKIYITVPNAFFIYGFIAAMSSIEVVHPEHYFYFSPSTLRRLLKDLGFKKIEIFMYTGSYMTDFPGITGSGVVAVCIP